MSSQDFILNLRTPSAISNSDHDTIIDIINKYPYFQCARILIAKSSVLKNKKDAKKNLATAAVYSTNRRLLKKYIKDELYFLDSKEKNQDLRIRPSTDNHLDSEDSSSPKDVMKENTRDLDVFLTEFYSDLESLGKSRKKFKALQKQIEEDEAITMAINKAKPRNELTEHQTEKDKNYQNDHKAKTGSSKARSKEDKVISLTLENVKSGSDKKELEKDKKSGQKQESTQEQIKKNNPIAFIKTNPIKEKTEVEPLGHGDADSKLVNKEETDDGKLKIVRRKFGKIQSTRFEKIEREENKEDVVDEFISSNPQIKVPIKYDSTSQEDLSEDSTRLTDDVASEYLAEIYLNQGKTERAIVIYQRLSLKFPEKKSFFANLIESLRNKEG